MITGFPAAATLHANAVGRPIQRRWDVWAEQRHLHHQPCFATEYRIFCEEIGCPWRAECMSLRAEWRR